MVQDETSLQMTEASSKSVQASPGLNTSWFDYEKSVKGIN